MRLLGRRRSRTRRRTSSGTASSSQTATTSTSTATTRGLDGGLGGASDDAVDRSYALFGLRPGFTDPDVGERRGHLPDLPRPVRERRAEERSEDRRRPLRRSGRRAAVEHASRGLLPELLRRRRDDLPWRFDTSPPDWSRSGGPARTRLHGRRSAGRDQEARLPEEARHRPRSTSTRSSRRSRTTATTPPTTRTVDPALGELKDFEKLVKEAKKARDPDRARRRLQPHVVRQRLLRPLPPLCDDGACESTRLRVAAVVHRSANSERCLRPADYDGWFGFDSIPTLRSRTPPSRRYFLDAPECDLEALARPRRRRMAPGRHRRLVLPRRLLGEGSGRS